MGTITRGAACFVGLCGLYLFFAGTVDSVEITVALVCAAVGTLLAVALERVAKRHFWVAAPPKAFIRPFASLLPEFLAVGREFMIVAFTGATGQRGDFQTQPFDPGDDDPKAHARRALAIIGVSFAPRTFVVRGEREKGLLLHGLPPKRVSADLRWPA